MTKKITYTDEALGEVEVIADFLPSPARLLSGGAFAGQHNGSVKKDGPMNDAVTLRSKLTCPHCGVVREETMPTDACMFFYECTGCRALLRPKPGDCCVFCSYGSVKCPPIQQSAPCCGPA